VFAVAVALQRGYTVEEIHKLTMIDLWFLNKVNNVITIERSFKVRMV